MAYSLIQGNWQNCSLIKPEAFYINAHQEIYRTALMLHTKGHPTDLIRMKAWLAHYGSLEKIGGNNKLLELVENVSSTDSIEQLAISIKDKFMKRQLFKSGNDMFQLGIDQTKETNEVFDRAEQKKNLDDSNDIDDLENFLKSQVFRFMKEYKITNAFLKKIITRVQTEKLVIYFGNLIIIRKKISQYFLGLLVRVEMELINLKMRTFLKN